LLALGFAALVADGVPAARIWLISFTRTAVVEMRNRIAAALMIQQRRRQSESPRSTRMPGPLQSGIHSNVQLAGFDDNIERTLQKS
jgi:superfamily I DNA/RNA helicase